MQITNKNRNKLFQIIISLFQLKIYPSVVVDNKNTLTLYFLPPCCTHLSIVRRTRSMQLVSRVVPPPLVTTIESDLASRIIG